MSVSRVYLSDLIDTCCGLGSLCYGDYGRVCLGKIVENPQTLHLIIFTVLFALVCIIPRNAQPKIKNGKFEVSYTSSHVL